MMLRLQPLDDKTFQKKIGNVQDGAHFNIAMNGFCGGCHERCYTDTRVFNPLASSNCGNCGTSYRKHELAKKKAYESRIQ